MGNVSDKFIDTNKTHFVFNNLLPKIVTLMRYEGVLIGSQPDQEGNKLQRPNSGFIQHTSHEAQYTS